jgi:hypothetical protein
MELFRWKYPYIRKNLAMFRISLDSNGFAFLNKNQLINLKTKAMRSGAWYKVTQRIDRALFDLTIGVVGNIRSRQLAKSILALTRKLENGVKGSFAKRLFETGVPLAQEISSTAQKLGNISANVWLPDSAFIRFLAAIHINDFGKFK